MKALLAVVLAAGLLAGCGLPLPEGVRSAGQVRGEQPESQALEVLPPGPRRGATAEELVSGFLAAQASPEGDHAVARQFLVPGLEWDDTAGVVLYRAGSQSVRPGPEPGSLVVGFELAGRISARGAFSLPPAPQTLADAGYTVVRERVSRELRLSAVPPGLRLSDDVRAGSFVARDVYFLGRTSLGEATARLVADRVFQPVTADPATALVRALLAGPTPALRRAVESAIPGGVTVAAPVRTEEGVVTVDLAPTVRAMDPRALQRLSAQLVWTLVPNFRGVRLRAGGRPLQVPGAGEVQDRSDWTEYDPSGLSPNAEVLYLAGRRIRGLDEAQPDSAVTDGGDINVDQAAASPSRPQLAVLTAAPGGQPDVVRTGAPGGRFVQAFSRPGLTSLTWGSGEQGLWVLQTGPAPLLWLLPGPDSAPETRERLVPYVRPRGAGLLSAAAVSRDGARIAMVFGTGQARRLYVGRIEPEAGGPAVRGVVAVAPRLDNVTAVAWESGTSLAVLAAIDGRPSVLAARVAVDGSATSVVNKAGLPSGAVSLAAAPDRPLVVGVVEADGRPQLYRDNGLLFRPVQAGGSRPFYPG